MDIGAVVLHKLVNEKSLDGWARIKLAFFDSAYNSIYSSIRRYYLDYNDIPNFEELNTKARNEVLRQDIVALEDLEDVPDIDLDLAIDALIDQYTQNTALNLIDDYVDKVTLMDSEDIKHSLSEIVMKLDEQTSTAEVVTTMDNFSLFKDIEAKKQEQIYLGINNTFDGEWGGAFRQDYIMIGGERGSGKSLVSANMVANQYLMGNTAVLFTIEMTANETMERISSMLTGIPFSDIKKNILSQAQYKKLVKMRADMFEDSDEAYTKYGEHQDPIRFEKELLSECTIKPANQIVIIDDRELSLTSIDVQLQKLKAQFGDSLTLCVVDYVNQVDTGIGDIYDWKSQIFASKKLKEYGRKHDLVMISPYQIDKKGEARFSKGLLDSPDIAFLLESHTKEDGAITLTSTKTRSGPEVEFTSPIDWDSLKISPVDIPKPSKKSDDDDDDTSPFPKRKAGARDKDDLPW